MKREVLASLGIVCFICFVVQCRRLLQGLPMPGNHEQQERKP